MGPLSPDVTIPEFRSLIDHAGWQVLPRAPGDDVQGMDARERVGKDGVVFSAYRIPRGPGRFGRVALEPPPPWSQSSGVGCDIPVEEICAQLEIAGNAERAFTRLSSRLDDVKSFLAGSDFARSKLDYAIAMLSRRAAASRSTLLELRPQLGTLAMLRALFRSFAADRRELARYRQVLRSLDG